MAEYIDKNQLIQRIKQEPTDGMFTAEILSTIDEIKTSDVAEVRHGQWIHEKDIDDVTSDYKCSVCDFDDTLYDSLVEKFYKYCPYCGSRLNGVMKNDKIFTI